jgi:hypothetical protein
VFYIITGNIWSTKSDSATKDNPYFSKFLTKIGFTPNTGQFRSVNSIYQYAYYRRIGSNWSEIGSYSAASYDKGGFINFGFRTPNLQLLAAFQDGAHQDSTSAAFGINNGYPIFVVDLAKLFGSTTGISDDDISASDTSKTPAALLRTMVGSNDPKTLIDSGVLVKSPTVSLSASDQSYTEISGGDCYWNGADGWSISSISDCNDTFGYTPSVEGNAYAILWNDLSVYLTWALEQGSTPTPTYYNIGFDVSGIPTGINVTTDLDLTSTVATNELKPTNTITFAIADGYKYSGATQYSINGTDWSNVSGNTLDTGSNTVFDVYTWAKNRTFDSDVTLRFRGYATKATTPVVVSEYNTVYHITTQDLYDIRNTVISYFSNSEVNYIDLSSYVSKCYLMRGDLPTGEERVIYLGNTNISVSGEFMTDEVLHFDCGSISLVDADSAKDSVQLWLPFYGYSQLDNAIGHTIQINYDMHLSNGYGIYTVYIDGILALTQQARNGFDLPLRITAANIQNQDTNQMTMVELQPFVVYEGATDWIKTIPHDTVAISGVPCTSEELETLTQIVKGGLQ